MTDEIVIIGGRLGTIQPGSTIILRPYLGDNAVDLANGGNQPDTPIKAMPLTRNLNQQWTLLKGPAGGWQFKNEESGTFLGTQAAVQADAFVTGQYQPIEFVVFRGDKGVNISPLGLGSLRLDYKGGSTVPPVDIWLAQADNSDAQEWVLDLMP